MQEITDTTDITDITDTGEALTAPETKRIRWPARGTVFYRTISVILGSSVLMVLIASGDKLGLALADIF